jgi:hypothetical protein
LTAKKTNEIIKNIFGDQFTVLEQIMKEFLTVFTLMIKSDHRSKRSQRNV